MAYTIISPAIRRFLTKYSDWARQGLLADALEKALQSPVLIGTFANDAAANLKSHPGLPVGIFVPGDRYYNSGTSTFRTNTASDLGAATWTVG